MSRGPRRPVQLTLPGLEPEPRLAGVVLPEWLRRIPGDVNIWIGFPDATCRFRMLVAHGAGEGLSKIGLVAVDPSGWYLTSQRDCDRTCLDTMVGKLAGEDGRQAVALGPGEQPRWLTALADGQPPLEHVYAWAPALAVTTADPAAVPQTSILAQTRALLDLPSYAGWSLPGTDDMDDLLVGLDRELDSLHPMPERDDPRIERLLSRYAARWLRALEAGPIRSRLAGALWLGAALHSLQRDHEPSRLATTAAIGFDRGLVLHHHPFTLALAVRDLARALDMS